MIIARRFDPRCGKPSAGLACSASSATTNRARTARAIGMSVAAEALSATTTPAPESRMTYSSSAGGCDTASGTGHSTGAPDAALHGCIRKARVHEERNPRLVQIVVVGQQRSGDALRGIVQIVVGEHAIHGDDGAARNSHPGQDTMSCMSLIDPGKKAPAFTLNDQHGKAHRLSDYAGKPVILYFYPKTTLRAARRRHVISRLAFRR